MTVFKIYMNVCADQLGFTLISEEQMDQPRTPESPSTVSPFIWSPIIVPSSLFNSEPSKGEFWIKNQDATQSWAGQLVTEPFFEFNSYSNFLRCRNRGEIQVATEDAPQLRDALSQSTIWYPSTVGGHYELPWKAPESSPESIVDEGRYWIDTGLSNEELQSIRIYPLQANGPAGDQFIDLLFVAEGFTQEEIRSGKFRAAFDPQITKLFETEPFKSFRNKIQIWVAETPSAESGVSNFGTGVLKNTFFGLGKQGVARWGTPWFQTRIAQLNAHVNADLTILVANSTEIGSVALSRIRTLILTKSANPVENNPRISPVLTHELGHLIGRLADVYFMPTPAPQTRIAAANAIANNDTVASQQDQNHQMYLEPGMVISNSVHDPLAGQINANLVPMNTRSTVHTAISAYQGIQVENKIDIMMANVKAIWANYLHLGGYLAASAPHIQSIELNGQPIPFEVLQDVDPRNRFIKIEPHRLGLRAENSPMHVLTLTFENIPRATTFLRNSNNNALDLQLTEDIYEIQDPRPFLGSYRGLLTTSRLGWKSIMGTSSVYDEFSQPEREILTRVLNNLSTP